MNKLKSKVYEMKLYKRWQSEEIETALETRRVVLLSGPRQCGKTTLAKKLISEHVGYVTLDDIETYQAAQLDPQRFVQHEKQTLIIDEIQRVPLLLFAIKKIVDENLRYGQFLLTGSANIHAIPTARESLAGRITTVRLRTLSLGEIIGAKPLFFEYAFSQQFNYGFDVLERDQLVAAAFKGGFPEAILLEGRRRRKWHLDYVKALVDRDLSEISNIHKYAVVRKLVGVLAAWSGKFMDKHAIGSILSLRHETLDSYINALESLYLIEHIPAWHKTDYDRVSKKSKTYMADSGLMSSVLSWRLEDIQLMADPLGKLIETFAMNELAAQIDASDGRYELYQYRDREKREIDFLVEREDGDLLGIEIKASTVVTADDFKHIRWFKENLKGNRNFVGIVLYAGSRPLSFGQDVWAIPFSMMWPKE